MLSPLGMECGLVACFFELRKDRIILVPESFEHLIGFKIVERRVGRNVALDLVERDPAKVGEVRKLLRPVEPVSDQFPLEHLRGLSEFQ